MGAISSFFGRLFGTEKALEGIVNGVSSGIDKLIYTKEEQADDASKERAEARSMVVKWLEVTQGQNLARRLIALAITTVWLGDFLAMQICGAVSVFLKDPETIVALGKVFSEGMDYINGAVMLILAFYFAAPQMGQIANAVVAKMSQGVK